MTHRRDWLPGTRAKQAAGEMRPGTQTPPLSLRALEENPQGPREELSLVRSPGKAKSLTRDKRNRNWALGCEGCSHRLPFDARVSLLWGRVDISVRHHRMVDGEHGVSDQVLTQCAMAIIITRTGTITVVITGTSTAMLGLWLCRGTAQKHGQPWKRRPSL